MNFDLEGEIEQMTVLKHRMINGFQLKHLENFEDSLFFMVGADNTWHSAPGNLLIVQGELSVK